MSFLWVFGQVINQKKFNIDTKCLRQAKRIHFFFFCNLRINSNYESMAELTHRNMMSIELILLCILSQTIIPSNSVSIANKLINKAHTLLK